MTVLAILVLGASVAANAASEDPQAPRKDLQWFSGPAKAAIAPRERVVPGLLRASPGSRSVCTLLVRPADPETDPDIARPVATVVDPDMILTSQCDK